MIGKNFNTFITLFKLFVISKAMIGCHCFLSADDFKNNEICDLYKGLARFPHPLEKRGEICCNSTKICYSNNLNSTWEHVPELPDCMETIEPEFNIFTPENGRQKLDFFELKSQKGSIHINSSRQFFTIVHGWNTDFWHSWVLPMKDVLINLGYNVMTVNWANGSNIFDYTKAVANTRTVADAIVEVMKFLNSSGKIQLANSTIIGFSLGAHIAGQAGGKLNNLWRIIGLDPAGPYFVCEDPLARLDETDANFVLVIHTNGDTILDGGLGTLEQMGHIDFYPDGGIIQQGCFTAPKNILNRLDDFDCMIMTVSIILKYLHRYSGSTFYFTRVSKLSNALSCSHTRATTLWTDILLKYANSTDFYQRDLHRCDFKSFPCADSKSWRYGKCFDCTTSHGCTSPTVYANSTNTLQRGKYFFNTLASFNESGQFCGRQYKLTLTAAYNAKGQILVELKGNRTETSGVLEFQKNYHSIKSEIPRSEILVTPWSLSVVTKMFLTYKQFEQNTKAQVSTLTLLNCTLTNDNGENLYWYGNVTIGSNVTVELDFNF